MRKRKTRQLTAIFLGSVLVASSAMNSQGIDMVLAANEDVETAESIQLDSKTSSLETGSSKDAVETSAEDTTIAETESTEAETSAEEEVETHAQSKKKKRQKQKVSLRRL